MQLPSSGWATAWVLGTSSRHMSMTPSRRWRTRARTLLRIFLPVCAARCGNADAAAAMLIWTRAPSPIRKPVDAAAAACEPSRSGFACGGCGDGKRARSGTGASSALAGASTQSSAAMRPTENMVPVKSSAAR